MHTTIEWRDNPDIWPIDATPMLLGNVLYTKAQLLSILMYPGDFGDGLNPTAREEIAAKLNIANGAGHGCIEQTIAEVDLMIGNLVVRPVGTDTIPIGNIQAFMTELMQYNKGELCCATHCPPITPTPTPSTTPIPTPTVTPTPSPTPTATATPTPTPTATPTTTPIATPTPTATPILGCVWSSDYWRDNPSDWCMGTIQLGQHIYSDAEARQIMNQPINNNGLVALAQELIAVKLSIACNYSDDSCIAQTVIGAETVIGNLIVPPVGNGFLPENTVNNLVILLAAYSKGNMCAPYCEATPTPGPCQLDKPAVECSTSASSNIAIDVSAGESGAPTGFVVEWMTMADFVANGNQWPDDPSAVCQATFSNNLAPNQTIEVIIGDDRLFDSVGVQSGCSGEPLLCDTTYVFRCRANASQSCDASVWGNTITCATLPCDSGHNCTYTQGFWKNHSDAWPVQNLMLGAVSYNASQLLQILNRPAQGNGLLILAHQLIAAKLNMGNGADPTAIQQAAMDADAMIGGLIVPPIGNGYLSPGQTSNLTDTLTEYNEGTIGPGHCND